MIRRVSARQVHGLILFSQPQLATAPPVHRRLFELFLPVAVMLNSVSFIKAIGIFTSATQTVPPEKILQQSLTCVSKGFNAAEDLAKTDFINIAGPGALEMIYAHGNYHRL